MKVELRFSDEQGVFLISPGDALLTRVVELETGFIAGDKMFVGFRFTPIVLNARNPEELRAHAESVRAAIAAATKAP